MIVSIHQPNFFPWLPFYQKIKAADVFVFLRHCQFQKNNYQNRFFYRDNWRTMSVNKGLDPIIEKKYVNPEADWNKIKTNLHDKRNILNRYDECISTSLHDTNTKIILKTIEILNIGTKIEWDEPTDEVSNERLISICKNLGATTYLAGSSGKNYMHLDKWNDAGIKVIFQELTPEIKQHVLDIL